MKSLSKTITSPSRLRHQLVVKAVRVETEVTVRHGLNCVSDLPMKGLEFRRRQVLHTEAGKSKGTIETSYTSYN